MSSSSFFDMVNSSRGDEFKDELVVSNGHGSVTTNSWDALSKMVEDNSAKGYDTGVSKVEGGGFLGLFKL